MKIEIFTEGNISLPYENISKRLLEQNVKKICRYLELNKVIITLIITDNKYIQNINREYRKKNRPTDIISFAYREKLFPSDGIKTEQLGDIFISFEKALENSRAAGNSFKNEIKHLLVHGILHLIGYDHERDNDDIKMKKKEKEIIKFLG